MFLRCLIYCIFILRAWVRVRSSSAGWRCCSSSCSSWCFPSSYTWCWSLCNWSVWFPWSPWFPWSTWPWEIQARQAWKVQAWHARNVWTWKVQAWQARKAWYVWREIQEVEVIQITVLHWSIHIMTVSLWRL